MKVRGRDVRMEADVVVMWGHGAQVQAAYRSWKGGNAYLPAVLFHLAPNRAHP